MPWFDDGRLPYQHHAEYLQRLSNLRNELINQEQVNLSNALERLRMRQQGKEYVLGRARPPPRAYRNELTPRKGLVTTFEQFKRSRPKRYQPEILPLEGRQLIEPQQFPRAPRSPHSSEASVSASSYSTRTVDDNVRNNIQRLLQPTSSIPNIGRKSTSKKNNLVLESFPLQRQTPNNVNQSASSQTPKLPKTVHRLSKNIRSVMKPDVEDLNLTPHTIRYENDRDKMNTDKLKEYYCVYYLPAPTPTLEDDNLSSSEDDYDEQPRMTNDKKGQGRLSPVAGKSILPQLYNGNINNSNSNFRLSNTNKRKERIVSDSSYHESTDSETSGENNNTSKKRIVVDMPSIVFNSATPDRPETDLKNVNDAQLHKTYKQNELRHRELKNLFEDVKELNRRTDSLSGSVMSSPEH